MACCALHKLKFESIEEFAEDTPNFSAVLDGFTNRRCQARVPKDGRHRVPLCAEDVEATDDPSLFDEEGYLVGLCGKHAALVVAEAVEGRACTGALCARVDPNTQISVSQPSCARKVLGSRLYCDQCFEIREKTGQTPAKPIRVVYDQSSVESGDLVSPLTEVSSAPGSDGRRARVYRDLGARLQEEQGGSRLREELPAGGKVDPVVGGAGDGATDDDDGSTTLADISVARHVREVAQSWAEDEALRRCKADEKRSDEMEAMKAQLSDLMEAVSNLSAQASAVKGAGVSESKGGLGSGTASNSTDAESGFEAASDLKGIESARGVAGEVMEKLRGKPPLDDPTASPVKRLEAQLAGGESDSAVRRSPEQLRAKSGRIASEVEKERTRIMEIVISRGRDMVARHGVQESAARIAEVAGVDAVSAVARALEEHLGLPGSAALAGAFAGASAVDADGDEDESEKEPEEADERDDDEDESDAAELGPEEVQYVHSDGVTLSRAHLLSEGIDDGRPPMRVRLVDSGRTVRASENRVLRGGARMESSLDAAPILEPVGVLGRPQRGVGARASSSVASGVDAAVARGEVHAAWASSSAAEESESAGGGDFDVFANWGSIRPDGTRSIRTQPSDVGRSVLGGDDRSRVSELSDRSTGERSRLAWRHTGGWESSLSGIGEGARVIGGGALGAAGPGHDASGMPAVARNRDGDDIEDQLKLATITFDDDSVRKPMKKSLVPSVTRVTELKEFDEAVFWLLRGAGDRERGPTFYPGITTVQVVEQVFNVIHQAAVSRLEYPFPVVMTDFVALALCGGALGSKSFEGGSAQEVKALGSKHVYYYKGRCLLLDDLVLKEDMPEDWAEREELRGAHVWPAGDVPRPRVRVGAHTKEETMVKRIKAYAELIGMFYNSLVAGQLDELANDYKRLASRRVNGRREYPLVVLSVAFETLMYKFMISLRSQAIDLVLHLEHCKKSTVRPHLFTNMRLAMNGRDAKREMAFVWPASFMNVTAADSDFMQVFEEYRAAGLLALTMGGAAAFSIPTHNKKPGVVASGAADVAEHDVAGENDTAVSAALSGEAPVGAKDADSKAGDAGGGGGGGGGGGKPKGGDVKKKLVLVRNVFGELYAPSAVSVAGLGLGKGQWDDIGRTWFFACKGATQSKFNLYCFAGACHSGCGKKKEQCEADWLAVHPEVVVKHGTLPMPLAKLVRTSPDPAWALVRVGVARGGGLLQHDKKIEPADVKKAVGELLTEHIKQKIAKAEPDGGSSGSVGASPRGPRPTVASGGAECEETGASAVVPAVTAPMGGGSAALWCRGRGGRVAPKSLAELEFDDIEQDLGAVVNDADARPAAPIASSRRVPARGLGDMFKHAFPSEEELWREATADWLAEASSLASDLAGQGAGVRSYVRSLGVTLLLAEVADPRSSDLTPDAAWALVRDRAFALAATSTDSAVQVWALSFAAVCGSNTALGAAHGVMLPAGPLEPGSQSVTVILGDEWPVRDHGEMLASGDDEEPERAKCLYLAIAAAVNMSPSVLLAALKSRARSFLEEVPRPKSGDMVPEALLYAFELAHDLLERDHPQMRASLLWFGDQVLSHAMIGFCCAAGNGGMTVEFFKGTAYDSASSACVMGFVECAASHARSLESPVSPGQLDAWQQKVASATGSAPGRWYMSGYPHIVRMLRGSRGQHSMRDPGTLWKCEICPSLSAPSIRVHMRRYIGAAAAAGSSSACCDPLMVMVEGAGLARLVSESRTVLNEISMAREAAAVAAAQCVVAGAAPPQFDSVGFAGGSERVGRSNAPFGQSAVKFSMQRELRSGAIEFEFGVAASSLALQGALLQAAESADGVLDGVERDSQGCQEALMGLEWLESALSSGSLVSALPSAAEKSPYEWGSTAHGTVESPACSTSLRQVPNDESRVYDENSNCVSPSSSGARLGTAGDVGDLGSDGCGVGSDESGVATYESALCGDIGTCVPVGTRPFGRPSHVRICRGGCGRAARSQGTPMRQLYLSCCDGCFFGWGHDEDCTEASRDGAGDDGSAAEKSPYEWGFTAHGTVESPACSTSLRQVPSDESRVYDENSDCVSPSSSSARLGTAGDVGDLGADGRGVVPEGSDVATCVAVGTRPFGRPSRVRFCERGCGRAARCQSGVSWRGLYCCDSCYAGRGHDSGCTGATDDSDDESGAVGSTFCAGSHDPAASLSSRGAVLPTGSNPDASSSTSSAGERGLGASRAITAEMKAAVDEAISQLESARDFSVPSAVEELVELWVTFPVVVSDRDTALRIAQIEYVTNELMKSLGRHEEVIRLYREEFSRRFGNHLNAQRIDEVPGLSDEVRQVIKSVSDSGVLVDEVGPRWDLRLSMNSKLAAEHGKVAVEKMVKDGRNGRIALFSSLVEKQLLADERRIMVAKVIRVAKRFLSGAVNPADSRWCNAQLDANTLTPAKGVGPGGSVKLPTQLDAAKGMLTVAFARPGLKALYSKRDVSEAFRLVWLSAQLCGLFATSIPRWVLGLGHGNLYCLLLALSFGSTISPGFFDYFSKAISMAHSSFAPPDPARNGALAFINFVLVDDIVLMGVQEGLCLLWSAMVCDWAMRMCLGIFAVNEAKGREEAPWEPKKILWGVVHDASAVHIDPLALRLQMTPVKREKAGDLFFNSLFNWGSFAFGRWQVQVLGGNLVFYGSVCRVMWPLMMRLAQVTYLLPDGPVGVSGAMSAAVREAYVEVWRVVELLRLVGGSPHWWDATFGGSVASTMSLRERLMFSSSEETLVWVGGDANMNGVAAGSWSDAVYAIVRTQDWSEAILSVVRHDLGRDNITKEQLLVAIWEFLCFLMIASACAERWANKVVLYVSDNMLVQRWITLLRARHDSGNFICGLLTLLMARFRFELYSVYINTERNMWDEPSRIFDADEVRKGPGVDEIDEYMERVFPGMTEISVEEQLRYYLRPGGLLKAYELYGMPDPVARSLARAREAPTSASLQGMTCVGLYSGIMAFEREVTALGGCIRAIGEWSAASRAIGRLDVGEVEYFEDVLSGDHTHVDPAGVEAAVVTASCVDYSTAGAQDGLHGTRGWQVVDSPRTLLHFRDLLVSLVENVWGWIDAHDGLSFAFYRTAMQRLRHRVWEPQRVNSRHLGMAIQSERAFVFTDRMEFADALGEPNRLDQIRLPKVPMKRKLLPVAEVLRRRSECELAVVPGSFRPSRVQSRDFGPVRIGDVEFSSRKADGSLRPGAKVKLDASEQVWRVLAVASDGRLRLRSGKTVVNVRPREEPVVQPFRIDVFSIDGQAFRVTASNVAEPPLFQSKAAYWESRCSPGFYRILLEGDGWSLMEKPLEQLQLWKTRSAEESADSLLPKTVPAFSSELAWSMLGNSIAARMSAIGVSELHLRWSQIKALISSGSISLEGELPALADELYEEATLKWRAATAARETFPVKVPDSHGLDDSHLNVVVKARKAKARDPDGVTLEEEELALGHLRDFAAGRGFADAVAYGVGNVGQGHLGAEVRRSTRSRSVPDTFQHAPTMKGGARKWREQLQVPENVTSAMARPPVRGLKRKGVKGEGAVVSAKLDWSGQYWSDGHRLAVRVAGANPNWSDEQCDEQLDREFLLMVHQGGDLADLRRDGGGSMAEEWSCGGDASTELEAAVAQPVVGPEPPPPTAKRKTRRKRGMALATLEGQGAFRSGDWNHIEAFATVRMPMFSVAWGTLKGYESAWKHWVSFQYFARLDIFLDCSTAAAKRRSGTWLLTFVAVLAYAAGYKASTIKKCLMAIRFFHLAHEYDNPLEKLPRVWQAYRAVKRQQGPTQRKHPITPEMCTWLDEHQRSLGIIAVIKRAARYLAIYLGCRCSEYLGPDIHWEKIILVSCVRPMKGDSYCSWFDDFDGIMVTFRASKTDQYNEGCKRFVGQTGNSMCAIEAFREWRVAQPGHFADAESRDVPMFTLPSGHVLGRAEVQADFREAAQALGLPTESIGTHSCRVACATWLYQAGYDIEFIKRHARWVGNSVHVYLWEGSGLHSMVKKMSEVKFKLHLHVV